MPLYFAAEAEKRGVHIHENIMITKLLKKDGRVIGAMGISPNKESVVFSAKAVVLAAGGANRLFPNAAHEISDEKYRTMGDAFYLAFDAGALLIDMEFAQFREGPPGASRFGGIYVNALGERFMEKYDPQALEKAPRHKVVEAVYREMKKGPVIWKVDGIRETELADLELAKRSAGHKEIELTIELQRLMGGARINEKAETPIPGLFAAGESAGGVHGGGRMQGNAFLETQIFGMNAGASAASFALNNQLKNLDSSPIQEEEARIKKISGNTEPVMVVKAIQQTMWDDAGIVRDEKGLRNACSKLAQLKKDMAAKLSGRNIFSTLEANNLLLTAEMMSQAALAREETRGSHIRNDFPKSDDKWLKHICITNKGGEIAISTLPIVTRSK